MELVLTEARGGGYRAHRPNCKKITDLEQFDAEELDPGYVETAIACSSCKPKAEDMDAMKAAAQSTPTDEDVTEEQVEEYESGPTELPVEGGEPISAGVDDEWSDDDEDLLGGDTDDEDLLGEEPEAPAEKPVDPPKVKAAPKTAKVKDPELEASQANELLDKVAAHLGIDLGEYTFPGFGKAVKTPGKQTVYLNSKGTADVRANSPEQASGWVEEGLAERRGGNYVRVNVRAL